MIPGLRRVPTETNCSTSGAEQSVSVGTRRLFIRPRFANADTKQDQRVFTILLDFNGIVRREDRVFGTLLP